MHVSRYNEEYNKRSWRRRRTRRWKIKKNKKRRRNRGWKMKVKGKDKDNPIRWTTFTRRSFFGSEFFFCRLCTVGAAEGQFQPLRALNYEITQLVGNLPPFLALRPSFYLGSVIISRVNWTCSRKLKPAVAQHSSQHSTALVRLFRRLNQVKATNTDYRLVA